MLNVTKLISIAGAPICSLPPELPSDWLNGTDTSGKELLQMLRDRNGFYAFESALHVFPAGTVDFLKDGYDLVRWNSEALWRHEYAETKQNCLFFAEDLFGSQFALKEGAVFRFDPETGDLEAFSSDLEAWAACLLADYDVETGYPLAHHWQKQHGPLLPGWRLVPKIPFVAGGTYTLENLYAIEAAEGMRSRADFARQIRRLPDGARIKLVIQ